MVLKVTVQVANIRMEPDSNSKLVKQVPVGTLLMARSQVGEWYEVILTDEAGNESSAYIHSLLVEVVSGGVEPEREAEPVAPPVRETVREPVREPARTSYPAVTYPGDYNRGGMKAFGGFLAANVTFSDIEGYDPGEYKKSRLGFFGGVGYESGSRLGFELDVMYMPKGVKYSGDISTTELNGSFEFTFAVTEVSVPLLLKMRLMPGSTPYIVAGGEVGLILSSKVKYKIETGTETISGTEDAKDSTASLDYGIVFGLGYELNSGPIPIYVEGRYHLGLADITAADGDVAEVQDEDWVKTNALVVMVGIRF